MSLQLQRYMIAWTSCLVIVLGGVIAWGALQPPTAESGLTVSRAFKLSRKHRSPASLPKTTEADVLAAKEKAETELATAQVAEFKLPCGKAAPPAFASNVAQVRLSGRSCNGREITSTEIRNDSNGSSATVFTTGAKSFTTDYLVLSPGENRIRVLHALEGGSREEHEVLLVRAARETQD